MRLFINITLNTYWMPTWDISLLTQFTYNKYLETIIRLANIKLSRSSLKPSMPEESRIRIVGPDGDPTDKIDRVSMSIVAAHE